MSRDEYDDCDHFVDPPKELNEAPPTAPETPDSGRVKPYKLVLARDITIDSAIKSFLIDGFLGSHEVSIWFGEPESGKSTVKIDAACHVAAGLAWCDRDVAQGAVLYVAAERGQLVRKRVLAWRLEHGINDFPLAIIDDAVDLCNQKVDTGRIINAAKTLARQTGKPVVWIIFDTLSRVLAGGDENSSRDMGRLVLSVDKIQRETKAHCSLVHHVPLGNGDRMRGHGALLGATDNTVKVTKQNGIVTVAVEKANDLAEDDKPQLCFRFKSIILSEDPRVTASVMIQAEDIAPTKASSTKPSKLSDSVKIAFNALCETINDCGEVVASTHAPSGIKTVTVEMWRQYAYNGGISSGGDRAKQKAFKSAAQKLIVLKIVGTWDDRYWIARGDMNP